MVRLVVLRALVVAAVFAVTWLAPRMAIAAIVPACENDAWSSAPLAQPSGESVNDCASVAGPVEEEGDPQVAPMCDPRGASALAPGRVHPMTDARIEAGGACDGGKIFGPSLVPAHDDHGSASAAWAVVDPAHLDQTFELRPVYSIELPVFPVEIGAPRAGFDRGVYHPPRG
ncbi:hypothetical protein [Polyangium aurulentum]|uniref:hypothetical protein n=1 Tax=Polyangium aurulentum TaxID=2567896 RepID=UPI0010AE4934|nr:hypothetical protein [Polyangium aurulentum]UQA55133.1 hypothetical protein E8A73_027725 [Polyangium aurulentum]